MGRTQVNLQVDPEKKQEWVEYVEESPETSNLSHLIRLSVTEHITGSDGTGRSERTGGGSGVSSEAFGEVLNAINSLDNRLTDVQEQVGAIERETEVEQSYDLQKAVYTFLPMLEEPEEGEKAYFSDVALTAEEIGTKLGADPEDVQDTIGTIMASTQSVRVYDPDDGEPMYCRIPINE